MPNSKYNFFQNKQCEYFPCHKRIPEDKFSCLFCYCPLYFLEGDCGGIFHYLDNGVKDCSNCVIPHSGIEGYEYIQNKLYELYYKEKMEL